MYVIGRTPTGRAGLQHEVHPDHPRERTLCGRPIHGRSRAYLDTAIPEVLCMRCTASRTARTRKGQP